MPSHYCSAARNSLTNQWPNGWYEWPIHQAPLPPPCHCCGQVYCSCACRTNRTWPNSWPVWTSGNITITPCAPVTVTTHPIPPELPQLQVDLTALKASLSAPRTGRCESWHDAEHAAVVFFRDDCLQWLCSRHLNAPCPGCVMHEAIDRSIIKVFCDRCRKLVPGFDTKHTTSGYYRRAAAWVQFFNDHEERVCDNCMFADPRYQKVYGKHEATQP